MGLWSLVVAPLSGDCGEILAFLLLGDTAGDLAGDSALVVDS